MKRAGLVILFVAGLVAAACGGSQPSQQNPPASSVAVVKVGDTVQSEPRPAMPGVNVPAVKVDLVGYVTDWKKIVIFNVDPAGAQVVDQAGNVVLTVTDDLVREYGLDEASQDPVWQVDITALKTPGTYTIRTAGGASNPLLNSDPFKIGDFRSLYYDDAVVVGLKSFYFQRTRTALVEPYAVWRGAAYPRKGVSHAHNDVGWDYTFYPDKKLNWKDSPDKQWWPGEQLKKGWFDAGNYDMYIPSTAPSTQILLYAYEWAPEMFKDGDQNIPESGNGVPDIIDESTWGLDWIMSLQQKNGAFRHSEAVHGWDGLGPADQDMSVRWIRGVSSAATAKAVAVLAQAAQIYKQFPPYAAIAADYEKAARLGWKWLQENPNDHPVDEKDHRWAAATPGTPGARPPLPNGCPDTSVNPDKTAYKDKHGSEQPRWDDGPDGRGDVPGRFVAAVEMWTRLRDASALEVVKTLINHELVSSLEEGIFRGSWVNISRYGLISLAQDAETPEDIRAIAKERMVKAADLAFPRIEKDGYRTCDELYDYYWGHNANLAEKVHIFAAVYKLTEDEKYLHAARDLWHWLNGRNPNGYSMTTGVGTRPPTRFYHMEWGYHQNDMINKTGEFFPPAPGYLLSGPNAINNCFLAPGAPAKALLWDTPETTRPGPPPHALWHCEQPSIWDGNFIPEDSYAEGWWGVTECDVIYSADYVLAGISVL